MADHASDQYDIRELTPHSREFPEVLRQIPSPPKQLFCRGTSLDELLARPRVAIVGSRSVSPYGRQVTEQLASKLAERGIVIVSGLALGVDAIGHRAALGAGGQAIAVLPGSLNKIHPATNIRLAEEILHKGGALVSEYGIDAVTYKQNFIARNRLVAGLAHAVLITEAAEKSGSLHTARFALEQGKDVLAVPGNIITVTSVGTNTLIKSGATPVTSYLDVLHTLGVEDQVTPARQVRGRNAHEQKVLDLLLQGVNDGEQLLKQSNLSISEFNQVLTMLEIGGKIHALGAHHWSLR
jgi:DNA processing protein